jgi:hypothetical protein
MVARRARSMGRGSKGSSKGAGPSAGFQGAGGRRTAGTAAAAAGSSARALPSLPALSDRPSHWAAAWVPEDRPDRRSAGARAGPNCSPCKHPPRWRMVVTGRGDRADRTARAIALAPALQSTQPARPASRPCARAGPTCAQGLGFVAADDAGYEAVVQWAHEKQQRAAQEDAEEDGHAHSHAWRVPPRPGAVHLFVASVAAGYMPIRAPSCGWGASPVCHCGTGDSGLFASPGISCHKPPWIVWGHQWSGGGPAAGAPLPPESADGWHASHYHPPACTES